MKNFILLSVLLLCSGLISAQQVTNLNDSGPGSLRGAVLAANAGDVITFSPSLLANGSDTIVLLSDLIINKGLTIQGFYSGSDTLFISGEKNTRLFYVDIVGGSDKHLQLKSLALVNGRDTVSSSDGHGGALLVLNADSLTIENCLFKGNENNNGGDGGACYMTGVDVRITGTTFLENKVVNGQGYCSGGAIYVYQGSLDIDRCSFRRNQTIYNAAGILTWDAPFRCSNSTFKNNDALQNPDKGFGGAIYTLHQKAVIDNCIFHNNRGGYRGGALYIRSSITSDVYGLDSVLNCSFYQNSLLSAQYYGGAVTAESTYIFGCTFDSNTTLSNNGGGTALSGRDLTVVNSTFSGHISDDWGIISVDGYTIFENVTVTDNAGEEGVITPSIISPSTIDTIELRGCIIAGNAQSFVNNDGIFQLHVLSRGYNVLYDTPASAQPTDITGVTSGLNMEPLAMNGGLYPTHVPMVNSPAYNAGDSTDFSDAQNGRIFGRRDIGAAERRIIIHDTTLVCGPMQWWGGNYSSVGTYTDTVFNANSIDSVGVLVLYAQDTAVASIDSGLVAVEQSFGTTYQWVNCDSSYSPVPGATDSVFLPTVNGNYAVVLTNGNCSDTSACVLFNRVSILEYESLVTRLEFYPNPTEGRLTLSSTEALPKQLEVLDLAGRRVAILSITSNEIQLPHYCKGVYLLKWKFEGGEVQVDRVIVE